MSCRWNTILYAIVQIIACAFVVIGTPLAMFQSRVSIGGRSSCITLWGSKADCQNRALSSDTNELWRMCTQRRDHFRAAGAFAIISIFVYGAAAAAGVIRICCCSCLRWICLVLNVVGIGTACIAWAVVVEAYYTNDTLACGRMSVFYKYGAGFALLVVAWVLDILNIIILMLP